MVRFLIYFAVLIVTTLIQMVILPYIGERIKIDTEVVLPVLIYLSFRSGSPTAEGLGFFSGFFRALLGVTATSVLGLYPLFFTVTGFAVGYFMRSTNSAPPLRLYLVVVFVFVFIMGFYEWFIFALVEDFATFHFSFVLNLLFEAGFSSLLGCALFFSLTKLCDKLEPENV